MPTSDHTWRILAAVAASGQGGVAARGVYEDRARSALHLLGGGHNEGHCAGGGRGALEQSGRVMSAGCLKHTLRPSLGAYQLTTYPRGVAADREVSNIF